MTQSAHAGSPAVSAGAFAIPYATPGIWYRLAMFSVVLLPFAGLLTSIGLLWGVAFDWTYLWLLVGMYVLTGLGITIGFHRLFTHKSFETGRISTWVWAVLGSMAVEGPLIRWVAMHRAHHQHSDKPEDPHSPHRFHHDEEHASVWSMLRGLWHAHMGWLTEKTTVDESRYAPDLQRDAVVARVSRQFPLWALVGLVIPAVLGGLITWSWTGVILGFLWGGLVRVFFVHHVTWSINSVCHVVGSRPFDCHDESRNNAIFGILAFGEGWHNNHHAFPTSARHGLAWWQLDTSYLVIRAMEILRIARRVRVPEAARIDAKRRAG